MKRMIWSVCALAAVIALGGCAGGAAPSPEPRPTLDAAATVRLARAARAAGDYASAINLYRTIAAGTADPAVKVELGDTLLDAGSIDEAIEVYQGVPTGSPASLGALLGLEHAYLTLDDLPKAIEFAGKAQALAPDDQRVLVDRGVALDLAGRHQEAQDSYRAVLAKSPNHRAARVNLALSLALTKNYDQATTLVGPIALSSTATPRERQDLALIYGLMGNEREARKLSLVDLDQTTTAANLRFFDFVRDRGP